MPKIDSFHPNTVAAVFEALQGPFAVDRGALYRYEGKTGAWSPLDQNTLLREIHKLSFVDLWREEQKNGQPVRIMLNMLPKQENDVATAIMRTEYPHDAGFARRQGGGIALRNKYVDVSKDGPVVTDNRPENYSTTSLPFSYDPGAVCPQFERVLQNLFKNDEPADREAKIKALAQFYGATLFGLAPDFARCLVLSGGGSNGKSTFQEIMQKGLFQQSSVSVSPARWDEEYYIATMLGMRLNTVSEIPSAEVFVSDAFKAFITGDQVTGRHPSGRPFDFNPVAGHVFSANELPATGDVSEGFWRRFLVVEFTAKFTGGSRANLVAPILEKELPGVFNWALRGAIDALRQGEYTLPLSHTNAMNEWKKDADALLSFLVCAGDRSGDIWTPFADVYKDYLEWTAVTRHGTMSANKFARRLVSAGVPKKRLADTTYYQVRMKERRFWIDVPGGGEAELKVVEKKETA